VGQWAGGIDHCIDKNIFSKQTLKSMSQHFPCYTYSLSDILFPFLHQ